MGCGCSGNSVPAVESPEAAAAAAEQRREANRDVIRRERESQQRAIDNAQR